MKIAVLANHPMVNNMYTKAEWKEVLAMAEFIGCFFATWWFTAPLAAAAPRIDLQAVSEMRDYKMFEPKAAEACLKSLSRHGWYLTEQLVVFCLFDKDLDAKSKTSVAKALSETPREREYLFFGSQNSQH